MMATVLHVQCKCKHHDDTLFDRLFRQELLLECQLCEPVFNTSAQHAQIILHWKRCITILHYLYYINVSNWPQYIMFTSMLNSSSASIVVTKTANAFRFFTDFGRCSVLIFATDIFVCLVRKSNGNIYPNVFRSHECRQCCPSLDMPFFRHTMQPRSRLCW